MLIAIVVPAITTAAAATTIAIITITTTTTNTNTTTTTIAIPAPSATNCFAKGGSQIVVIQVVVLFRCFLKWTNFGTCQGSMVTMCKSVHKGLQFLKYSS